MDIYTYTSENFTATDRTPYTYLIVHKPTGKLYYGAKWKKDCLPKDFWITYFILMTHKVFLYLGH